MDQAFVELGVRVTVAVELEERDDFEALAMAWDVIQHAMRQSHEVVTVSPGDEADFVIDWLGVNEA